MTSRAQHNPRNASGFSLVEVMVGMVIGLIGMIVVMQVSTLYQSQKNVVSNNSKAQNNGAIALYGMQRDIEQAGYGINTINTATSILGCSLQLRPGVILGNLAPLSINDSSIPAGDPNTDTVLVAFSNTLAETEGDPVNNHTSSPTSYVVGAPRTFNVGDNVIAQLPARASPCALTLDTVTAVDYGGATVTVATGSPTYPVSTLGALFNLGPTSAIKIHAYAVRNSILTECDFMANDCSQAANTTNPAIWVPISDNIVSLRAEYGRDISAPMDGIVDKYDQSPPNTLCKILRIPAMRFALVARNSQFQKTVVTTTASNGGAPNAPTWAGDPVDKIVGGGGVLGPGSAPDEPWKHYRYKVFETSVPIRNIAWMGAVTGC